MISHLPDGLFFRLEYLCRLDLSGNLITHLTNQTFRGLEKLHSLNLNDNKIRILYAFMFTHAKKLCHLFLQDNPISRTEADTFRYIKEQFWHKHFQDLNLSNTNIQYTLKNNSNMFRDARIQRLYLRGNNLTHIPRGAFSKVKGISFRLRVVDFSYNSIVSLSADLFEGFSNCHNLYLDHNHISFIDLGTFYITSILVLSLSHNKLPHFQLGIFKNDVNLERFDLSHNEISYIAADEFNGSMNKLIYLNLKYNKLTELGSSAFINIPILQNLYLNQNRIAVLHMKTFYELPELKFIDLRRNNISYLDPGTFIYNIKLNTLLLDGNNITECIWLENLPQGLQTLNFTNITDVNSEVCFKKSNCSSFGKNSTVNVSKFKHHFCEFCQCQCPQKNCSEECGGRAYQILTNKYGCMECKCSCLLPDCEYQCDGNTRMCVKGMYLLVCGLKLMSDLSKSRTDINHLWYLREQ